MPGERSTTTLPARGDLKLDVMPVISTKVWVFFTHKKISFIEIQDSGLKITALVHVVSGIVNIIFSVKSHQSCGMRINKQVNGILLVSAPLRIIDTPHWIWPLTLTPRSAKVTKCPLHNNTFQTLLTAQPRLRDTRKQQKALFSAAPYFCFLFFFSEVHWIQQVLFVLLLFFTPAL